MVSPAEPASCAQVCINACVHFRGGPPSIRDQKTYQVFNFVRLVYVLGRKVLGFDDSLSQRLL